MTRIIAPCKGCKERVAEPNCHTTCERYLTFRRLKDEQNAELHKKAVQESIQNDIERDRIRRASTGQLYRSGRRKK